MALKHYCYHRRQLLADFGKFLQALVKVKVTRGSTVEEEEFEPRLMGDKDDEEGH